MKIEYPAQIEKAEDGIFFVSFPDIEEAMTQGENMEEALFNASEVLTLTLEYRLDEDREIPEPSQTTNSNTYLISPSAKVQAALLNFWIKVKEEENFAKSINTRGLDQFNQKRGFCLFFVR